MWVAEEGEAGGSGEQEVLPRFTDDDVPVTPRKYFPRDPKNSSRDRNRSKARPTARLRDTRGSEREREREREERERSI